MWQFFLTILLLGLKNWSVGANSECTACSNLPVGCPDRTSQFNWQETRDGRVFEYSFSVDTEQNGGGTMIHLYYQAEGSMQVLLMQEDEFAKRSVGEDYSISAQFSTLCFSGSIQQYMPAYMGNLFRILFVCNSPGQMCTLDQNVIFLNESDDDGSSRSNLLLACISFIACTLILSLLALLWVYRHPHSKKTAAAPPTNTSSRSQSRSSGSRHRHRRHLSRKRPSKSLDDQFASVSSYPTNPTNNSNTDHTPHQTLDSVVLSSGNLSAATLKQHMKLRQHMLEKRVENEKRMKKEGERQSQSMKSLPSLPSKHRKLSTIMPGRPNRPLSQHSDEDDAYISSRHISSGKGDGHEEFTSIKRMIKVHSSSAKNHHHKNTSSKQTRSTKSYDYFESSSRKSLTESGNAAVMAQRRLSVVRPLTLYDEHGLVTRNSTSSVAKKDTIRPPIMRSFMDKSPESETSQEENDNANFTKDSVKPIIGIEKNPLHSFGSKAVHIENI
eukprot:TRINITY_DN782035_c0_g1_i1.p1 TRINITY_DN782035_c0_g1~~TRINITY_DN782035_c0_g1_i1.p1  ORF type:complete len:498 (-),score=71.87 TRINITY_DN782035_c0_g1_i1:379-1872(-)